MTGPAQPPLDEIAKAVEALSGGTLSMVMPDTGSQEYELVITGTEPRGVTYDDILTLIGDGLTRGDDYVTITAGVWRLLAAERSARMHAVGDAGEARCDLNRARVLHEEVLAAFDAGKGDGYRARVGQVRYGQWRERAASVFRRVAPSEAQPADAVEAHQ